MSDVKRPARVLIVDDEEYVRELLRLVLIPVGGEIAGEAADGAQATRAIVDRIG